MALVGIDAGTTACKVTAFSAEGRVLASARKEYRLRHPRDGWAELIPQEIWEAVVYGLKKVTAESGEPIQGMAVSSQGEGLVLLDEKMEAAGHAIVSFDLRTLEQTRHLKEVFGNRYFFDKGGQLLSSMGTATKIMWCRENPGYFQRPPKYFMCVGDYILFRLTGEMVSDFSLASRTMMVDIKNRCWNQDLLSYIGISESQLPTLTQAGTYVGKLTKKAAEEIGGSPEVLMAVGGHDQPCAMLGTGANDKEEATYSLGTTETLVCAMEDFREGLYDIGLPCYPHVLKERYITLPGNFTGGNLLGWYGKNFADNESFIAMNKNKDIYDILMEEMDEEVSPVLVLPHFTVTGSPWNDSESSGIITGLQLSTTKGQYLRGLQEGVTMEILLNLLLLRQIGTWEKLLYVVGGGTKSRKLLQLKADVLGTRLYVPKISEAPCRGAALLAGQGCGLFQHPEKVWLQSVDETRIWNPRREMHEKYLEKYKKYERLYPAVKAIFSNNG